MTKQSTTPPKLNNKYYASLMFKSSADFTVDDSRFEFYYKDSYIQADGNVSDEDGTEEGLLRFILKDIQVLDWTKMSSINQLTLSTYLNESWVIRNFQRMTNDVSYTDALMIVDLTETFGSGNEPSIEWCDENIEYFEGTSVIYK